MYAKRFDDVSLVPILYDAINIFRVFFSIDLLPNFWAGAAQLNPILYVVNAFRYGILGVSDISLGWAYGILLFMNVATYIIAVRLLADGAGVRS